MHRRIAACASASFLLYASGSAGASDAFPDRFNLVLGGMRPGSGVGGGFEYLHSHFATGFFDLRLESRVSIRLYQQHEAEIVVPHLVDQRLFLELLGLYRSYTEVDYFGIGPGSPEEAQSDYRLDGPAFFATIGFRPARKSAFGGRFGTLSSNIRSGRSDVLPSIEENFRPSELPGFEEEPDFLLFGAFAFLDKRNDPEDPTRGARYEVQLTSYRDRGLDRFNFEELSAEAQHFVPLTPKLTFASRVQGIFTRTGDGMEIPFYLLPSLGGTRNLHAFENDRFRDRNLLFINNELRYQATLEIRVEAFVDVGQVFPRLDGFRFSAFEISSGLGIHYKLGRKILTGISVGVGREGMRASITGDFRF